MSASPQTKTFSSTITVCARCGREVSGIMARFGTLPTILSCGHPLAFKVIRNPELPPNA